MPKYLVVWEMDFEAYTPKQAAKMALEVQRNPESIATVFKVIDRSGNETVIDLEPTDE